MTAISFLVWRASDMPWRGVGGVVLVASAAAYLTLIVTGVASLAERRVPRRTALILVGLLSVPFGLALPRDPMAANAGTSSRA